MQLQVGCMGVLPPWGKLGRQKDTGGGETVSGESRVTDAPPPPNAHKSQGTGFLSLPSKGQVLLVAFQGSKRGGWAAVCVLRVRPP